MNGQSKNPFESIESAHDFFRLLSEEVLEAEQEIDAELHCELDQPPRRRDALLIASYSLEKLEAHMIRSRRILNDLRSLRRLLFSERIATRRVRAVVAQTSKVADQPAWVQRPQGSTAARPSSAPDTAPIPSKNMVAA